MDDLTIKGNLVDVLERRTFPAEIRIKSGHIERITPLEESCDQYILPGFVDAHVHIESSMVTPVEFSRECIGHGTIGVMTDPHEIANVLGKEGVNFMTENAERTPLKILFGAPSCVPATPFEKAGGEVDVKDIEMMFEERQVSFLSEMMNYPGVIQQDQDVLRKISVAKRFGAPIDGHAPGVRGEDLEKYVQAGISTDHESFSLEEASEKIEKGMHILIREGSGAKNFEELIPLMRTYPDKIMFCTDDLHPDDLLSGHINQLVRRAVELGYDLYDVLRAASYNAIMHYQSGQGLLRVGDSADFIVVENLRTFEVKKTCIDGDIVYENKNMTLPQTPGEHLNVFREDQVSPKDFFVPARGKQIRVMIAKDGSLVTGSEIVNAPVNDHKIVPDIQQDLLKIAVVNRYETRKPQVAFIKGFGLEKGAIASSIAHDSHNIIGVAASDEDLAEAVNWIIQNKGGIV